MKRKKKAVPGVAAPKDGKTGSAAGATNSLPYSTMRKGPVASILLTGKKNAIPGREIMRILKLREPREVSALVEMERRSGAAICATTDSRNPGYFLAETPGELQEYVRSLQGRIREVTVTSEALETTLDTWTGQQRLDLPKG